MVILQVLFPARLTDSIDTRLDIQPEVLSLEVFVCDAVGRQLGLDPRVYGIPMPSDVGIFSPKVTFWKTVECRLYKLYTP